MTSLPRMQGPPYSAPELHSRKKPTNNFWCPCFWIITAFVLFQLLIISITRNSPPSAAVISDSERCPSGKVYVYNLPPVLNEDLVLYNCTDLHIWNAECGMAANHGFGNPATELHHLLPESLSDSWFRTNPYALELIFHRRILQHKCRTLEPESAAAFYIPFYVGLAALRNFYVNDTAKRDWYDEETMRWVQRRRYWKKSNGSDHFTTVGRITWDFRRDDTDSGWGSRFLIMPEMKRVNRFIIEKAPWDHQDIAVPYPTGFHPQTSEILNNWQHLVREYNRSSLFTFVGRPRPSITNDFRGMLMSYCSNESLSCRVVDCETAHCVVDSYGVLESFLGSDFCLQPAGDSPTRRSVFDCMIAGSIPVLFSKETAYNQYVWFLPDEPESYSVYIDQEEVRNRSSVIKEVLMKYSKEDIRRKREKVIETIPRIIYGGGSPDFKDAFEIALDGVLERITRKRE